MPCSWEINSFEDTDKLALEIKERIKIPQFIGLIGPMGVGKTYFVKSLAKALNLFDVMAVNSPSFALHQQYQGNQFSLEHLDLFRLDSEDDLESTGFWDLFAEEKAVIVVEWADRINRNQIPKRFNPIFLQFEFSGDLRKVRCMP
jgi:tRNA threonylcarbamoyladenosine biosynthesis protein TsaE